jgi:glucosamine--fructose-6-phosphate aminotransferase (isomerizing)
MPATTPSEALTETHLYREIHEQPAVLARLLEAESATARALAEAIRRRAIQYVLVAARGTSDNAGRYAQYLLGSLAGLPVALTTPSLFSIYEQPPRLDGALVLGISQSGRSPDIVSVLAEARRQGALAAVITNTPDSELAEHGDFVLPLHAGVEQAVAATKTYTAELAAVALLGAHLNGDPALLDQLAAVPQAVADTLATDEAVAAMAPRYRYMQRCLVIGRGYNYATAFELALKLKELTYTRRFRPFVETVRGRGAEVIAISDVDELLRLARIPLLLPHSLPEWLSPLTAIVPGQLLALHLAATRDLDVDAPRAIDKVTETA